MRDGAAGGGHIPGRRGRRPRLAAGGPIPAVLVGIGLAWMAFAERRRGGRGGGAGRGGVLPADAQGRDDDGDAQSPTGAGAGEGRHADTPTQIPARGWWAVAQRVVGEVTKDNMGIIAAGCAFYALLALFPAVTALVSIYGLVADPATVERQIGALQGVVPQDAFNIIRDQAHAVASGGSTALGWGAALSILLALYSASSGVKSLFEALNIAYEEEETRGFVRYNLVALGFTLAAVVGVAVVLGVLVGIPAVLSHLPLGPLGEWGVRIASWVIMLAVVTGGIALTYRFGPSRAPASWAWLTPGSIAATVLWLAASAGFSYYAANFGSYNETYGALAGVIVLLLWLWISAYVLLLGAELNSELELQTARDTTTGAPLPKGERSAYAADHTHEERAAGA